MLFIKKTLPVLLAVFLLSILVRWPQLNRPLSKHHEFCTAVSLRILDVWNENGIENVGFNPSTNYASAANKNINNFANETGKVKDEKGNYYYVSHPPFAYYVPYLLFKIISIKPSVLALQIFNLILHFFSALFVYFTVCLLSFKQARSTLHFASFISYSIYLFLPATLWFQGNVYMSDMAVQLPFITGVYIVLKMIIRQRFTVPKYIFFYSLNLAILIYTSWLGLFFAFGVFVYSLLHVRQINEFRVLIWSTIGVSFLILQLLVFQYSSINGMEAYFSEMLHRYVVRGSVGELKSGFLHFLLSYFIMIKNVFVNYILNYFPLYILILAFLWISATQKKMKITFTENGYRFLWLSILPIILLHLVFLNYSTQDFTVLYASLFFSVLGGVLYDKVKKSGAISPVNINRIMIATLLILIVQYTVSNLPGEQSIKGYKYSIDKDFSQIIKANIHEDEVVFVNEKPSPQLVYYTHRNMLFAKDTNEAKILLANLKMTKGVYFIHQNPPIISPIHL